MRLPTVISPVRLMHPSILETHAIGLEGGDAALV